MTKKPGFSVIEGLIALVVISLSTAAIGGTVVGIAKLSSANMNRQAREQERTTYQEVASLGYAPEKLSVRPLNGVSSLTTTTNSNAITVNRSGSARITGLTASLDNGQTAMEARASAMGLQITTQADAVPATMALRPPSFSMTDNTTPAAFPVANLILGNGANPPGTYYVYTTNGVAPSAASTRWNTSTTFDVTTYPRVLMAQAYHPDPSYLPSSVVTLTLSYPTNTYAFRRQDNSTGKTWTYIQVMGNQNGVKPSFNDTAFNAVVTFLGSGASQTHANQNTVSQPTLGAFAGVPPTGTVRIVMQPKNSNFTSTNSQTINETITGTEIVLPNFGGF